MNPNLKSAPRFTATLLRASGLLIALGVVAPLTSAQTNPPTGALPAAAVVDRPLLPPSNDVPGEQPSPEDVWVPGHWRWGQGSYVWVAGSWALPPVPNASWVAPQWVRQDSGYVLREGFWQQNPPPTGDAGGAAAPQASTVQPPPPAQPESIPEQPAVNEVWQPGYWDWRNDQFVWVNGRWTVPPRPDVAWVAPHWQANGNRYDLMPGYWRDVAPPQPQPQPVVIQQPQAPQVVVVTQPPPPPPARVEYHYGRHSRFDVWVPGYWAWTGTQYVWVAGHWSRPPHGRHIWVEPRWEHRGGNYVFIEGHWR